MKFIFALVLSFLVCPSICAQSEQPENASETDVAEIHLARDDGSGKAGDAAAKFLTADVPIYCLIKLASVKAVSVKMNFVYIGDSGLKPDRTVVSVVYKTDGKQTGVTFTASPDKIWAAGKYRADVSLDGKLAKSLNFEIESSSPAVAKEKRAETTG